MYQYPLRWFLVLAVVWIYSFAPLLLSLLINPSTGQASYIAVVLILSSLYLFYDKRFVFTELRSSCSQWGLALLAVLCLFWIVFALNEQLLPQKVIVVLMLPAIILTTFGIDITLGLIFPILLWMLVLIVEIPSETTQLYLFISILLITLGLLVLENKRGHRIGFATFSSSIFLEETRWLFPCLISVSLLLASPWLSQNLRILSHWTEQEIVLNPPLGIENWAGPIPVQKSDLTPVFVDPSSTLQVEYFRNEKRLSIDKLFKTATESATENTTENTKENANENANKNANEPNLNTNEVASKNNINENSLIQENNKQNFVYLYSAYYDSNRSVQELLNPINRFYDPLTWRIIHSEDFKIDLSDRYGLPIHEQILASGLTTRVVWYWYYVAGVTAPPSSLIDLLEKVRIISKYSNGSGVIVLSSYYTFDPNEARKRLKDFLEAMFLGIETLKYPEHQ